MLPEGNESLEKITYQAASLDESTFVIAANNFGFFFYRQTSTTIRVRESCVEKMGTIQDVGYEIQFISSSKDKLNMEIALGTVTNVREASCRSFVVCEKKGTYYRCRLCVVYRSRLFVPIS